MINDYPVMTIGWNIFLLLIPYIFCRLIVKIKDSRLPLYARYLLNGLSAFIWLIFIPNTAYIISDIRHLNEFCPGSVNNICLENAWQIMVFFAYGVIGWVSYVYLLDQMAQVIKKAAGRDARRLFLILIIPLIALGVLLGLLDRWNSWEVFLYPGNIIASLFSYALIPARLNTWLVYTLFLYFFYLAGKRIFLKPFNPAGIKMKKHELSENRPRRRA